MSLRVCTEFAEGQPSSVILTEEYASSGRSQTSAFHRVPLNIGLLVYSQLAPPLPGPPLICHSLKRYAVVAHRAKTQTLRSRWCVCVCAYSAVYARYVHTVRVQLPRGEQCPLYALSARLLPGQVRHGRVHSMPDTVCIHPHKGCHVLPR